jgi:hypothetical protein
MEKTFDSIFNTVQNDLKQNLEAGKNNAIAKSSEPASLKGKGTIPFDFYLNEQGEYNYSIDKYGAGVKVYIAATITEPDAIYDITVKSSDGGGGHWTNVKTNQEVICVIDFWHSTKIEVQIKANVVNQKGKGVIKYNY